MRSGVSVMLFACAVAGFTTAQAAQKTATWTGGGDGASYSDPLNWDIGEVPVNNVTDTFVVVIGTSSNVAFDIPDPGVGTNEVYQFSLAAGSSLTVNSARHLSVQDSAAIGGTISAPSGGFSAPSAASSLTGTAAKIGATGTGVVVLGAGSYDSTAIQGGNIISADGTGAAVNLPYLQSINDATNYYPAQTRSIIATNNGSINLSGLTQISGGAGDDTTRLAESSGGSINLSSLTTVTNNVLFSSDKATFSLPSLISAQNMTFALNPGHTLNLVSLTQQNGGAYTLGAADTVNLNSLTQLTNARVTISDNLSVFNAPALANINNSFFNLSGGAQLTLSVANYVGTNFAGGNFFSADGTNTLLNLSAMRTLNSAVDQYPVQVRSIVATNGGTVDLTNLTTINGGTGDDYVELKRAAGGTLLLTNLTTTTGNVRFNTDTNLIVPKLANAESLFFTMQPGSSLSLPELISQTGGSHIVPAGGSVSAPKLTTATGTTINISDAAASFSAPLLSNINNSFVNLSGGARLMLPLVTHYVGTAFAGGTFFSAQGVGTLLDLANLQTIDSYVNPYPVQIRTLSATDGGVVDLSSVTTLKGGSGDDWLQVRVGSSGMIDLSALQSVSVGNVRFDVDAEGTLKLGDFTVTGNTTFNINDVTSTVQVAGSLLLDSPSHFNVATGGGISVGGNFSFATTDETAYQSSSGILTMTGMGTFGSPQYLEVGGLDAGLGDPGNNDNFGLGQLIIGTDAQATVVSLVDLIDNGNRAGPESLYLFGLGGPDGLMLRGGSTLVIDNIHAYAWVNGDWLLLNDLFTGNITQIDFGAITNNPADAGFIVIPEPATIGLMMMGGVMLSCRRRR